MKKILFILPLILLVSSCDNNISRSQDIQSSSLIESELSTSSKELTFEEKLDNLEKIRDTLLTYDESGIVSNTYESTQLNNYYGLDIETKQEGEETLYKDNFYQNKGSQTIGESSTPFVNEKGYDSTNNIYYSAYAFNGTVDESLTKKYTISDDNVKYFFSVSFIYSYIFNTIDSVFSSIDTSSDYTYTLDYDLSNLNLEDGEKEISLSFIVDDGTENVMSYNRKDKIKVSDKYINYSESFIHQGLINDTNYTEITSKRSYIKGSLQDYSGEKLEY